MTAFCLFFIELVISLQIALPTTSPSAFLREFIVFSVIPNPITTFFDPFCFLKDTKRARYTFATDEEALNAYKLVTKYEKLNPSLEPSHAFAEAIKIAPRLSKNTICIVNSCGDAKKDRDILKQRLGKY